MSEGVGLAKSLKARLTLLTVIQPYHVRASTPFGSTLVHDVEKVRDEEHATEAAKMHTGIMERARGESVDCASAIVIGESPYAQIIDTAEARQCDLIIMASHGRRGLDALLLGSETVKVLTHSKIPVLVVR